MYRAQRLIVAALLTLANPLLASRLPSRPSDALVHDLSGTLGPSAVADLERRADAVQRAGATVAVLVRIEPSDVDDTRTDARRLLSEWRVEREPGRADGVAIVVNLRKGDPKHGAAALQVGKSLAAGKVPTEEVERIWKEVMRPAFLEGHISEGIAAGLAAVELTLREGPPPPSPTRRAAAELATGVLLPLTLAAGIAGVIATARLSRRRQLDPLQAGERSISLGPVRGGVLARRRVADGVALGGLLDLASRGAVTLKTGPAGTLLAQPTGQRIDGTFETALLAIVVERARKTGEADLGTAPWASGLLGKAIPALRAEMTSRGLLDPLKGRRSARAAIAGGLLFALAGVLLVAAGIGNVPGPIVAALLTFGSAFALFIRAVTLPETTVEGEREGAAWRSYLAGLAAPPNGDQGPVDLGRALPFLLAAGRSDLVPRLAKDAQALGVVPAWLSPSVGGDGADLAMICSTFVATSDSSSASCSDGGAGGSF